MLDTSFRTIASVLKNFEFRGFIPPVQKFGL